MLVLGIPSEPPVAELVRALARANAPYLLWSPRDVLSTEVAVEFDAAGSVTGELEVAGECYPLDLFAGVYVRLTDLDVLPELDGLAGTDAYARAERVHELLLTWLELAPARVVNRTRPMASNGSKPYQAQVISRYFLVPETLVTNDTDAVLAFRAGQGEVVYKSVSAQRSIVQTLVDDDVGRLSLLARCPAQFQRRVAGTDVRVHTIGSSCVFPTAVDKRGDRLPLREAPDRTGRADAPGGTR